MSAPLTGAGYLRPPVRSGTKAEVLARCFEAIANNDYQTPSMEERLLRRFENEVWQANEKASMRPGFVPENFSFTPREDERLKHYRRRGGAVSND